MSGWNILACADMVMPMYSTGTTDMFHPTTWDAKAYSEYCQNTYGIQPNYDWTLDFYGGKNDKEYLSYSNIFFSNGLLDPWSGGGPTEYLSESLPIHVMPMSAHHLDLRSPNPKDPIYV